MANVYDASKITTLIDNKTVTGYKKGSFVTANKDEENVTAESNAHGEVIFSRNNSGLGTVTITLNQTSPFVKILNNYANTNTAFPIWVDDPTNKERRGGTEAFVTKVADASYSESAEGRAYTIKVAEFKVDNY